MAWTYTNDPANIPRDAVRFLSGDNDEDNQQASDEEIAFLLTESNDDRYLAAAGVCEAAAGKAARNGETSKRVGDLSISYEYAEQSKAWLAKAESLRSQAARQKPATPRFYTNDDGDVFGRMKFSVGMDDYR